MQTVIGVFESGEAARKAVGHARDAGFALEDISFILSNRGGRHLDDGMERAADAGRRFGTIASDVGETAVRFLPFLGRDLARGPMAGALRHAAEEAGESAGRILDAAAHGGFMPIPSSAPGGRVATVEVRAPDERVAQAAAVLTAAGAVETEVAPA